MAGVSKAKAKADKDSPKKRKDLSGQKVFNPKSHVRADPKVSLYNS
jgi:hypothetical protein